MIKYTHKENADMLAPITLQAYMLGLVTADEKLTYEKGGRGTATVIRLVRRDSEGNLHRQMRPQWVPEFGYKDGPSVVGNALARLADTLYAFGSRPVATDANGDDRYYWDLMSDYTPGEDAVVFVHPYGDDTARIIDSEAGVIAYVHRLEADKVCRALGRDS